MDKFSYSYLFLILKIFSSIRSTFGALLAPDLDPNHYYYPGDINIGVIGYLHSTNQNGICGNGNLMGNDVVQQPESIYYSVNKINQRSDILPNISLGFVFMDGCLSPTAGSARAVYFIEESNKLCSVNDAMNNENHSQTFPPWFNDTSAVSKFTHYKVAGVVGPPSSGEALTVGALLSAFGIPVLGTFSSSDQLSDEGRFKYFSRLVPPDNFQTQAMVDVLEYFGWSYVSVLYAEGNYGENAGKQFTKWVKTRDGICIAFSYMIPNEPSKWEIKYIADNLERYKNARVVALFAAGVESLLRELDSRNLTGHFIWFGSDTVAETEHTSYAKLAEGALYMNFEGVSVAPKFETYFRDLNPWNATSGNPWLVKAWAGIFQCSWNESLQHQQKSNKTSNQDSCYSYTGFGDEPNFRIGLTIGKLIDGVDVYALALDRLIHAECPGAFQDKTLLNNCISGDKLLTYMRNISFFGVTGNIQFDRKGDILGAYSIVQIQHSNKLGYHGKQLGVWDKLTETVTVDRNLIIWPLNKRRPASRVEIKDNETLIAAYTPESMCSWPCEKKLYRIQQELPCCWLCSKCRDNERIINNNTACELCPENTWPDDITATECLPIADSYLRPLDGISIGLLIMSSIGIMSWFGIVVIFIKKREEKLIKACNLELSFLILIGALLALITVYVYVAKPTQFSCVFREVGFHMSVNILFGPLLVKTNRVYRIFESGKKSVQRPPFVTAAAQRVFTAIVCLLQVILIIVMENVSPIKPIRRMPVRTEKYVELICNRTIWVFLTPLIYNIAMITMCAVYGFRTRKLPQNFNESWFIFISVATTLFAWVVLLPSYFNAFYAYHQEALLALCLIINVFIALLCQYGPKIYAIYYVDKDTLQVTMTYVTGVQPETTSGGGSNNHRLKAPTTA